MVLNRAGSRLALADMPEPKPGLGEIRVRVAACGVCRTDLHVVDGDLPSPKLPLIPGHEIVGRIDEIGSGVSGFALGTRVGIPWLGWTCGTCPYCRSCHENLCDYPLFTGYTRDGGYAAYAVADARYAFPLDGQGDDASIAPLLCAGLIGWRSLVIAGPGKTLGVARWQGRRVFAFTRPGDAAAQDFARSLRVEWAGGSDEPTPEPLDAAIIYAPVGALVPAALSAVRKGGRVVCAGIHMSDIPGFSYDILWSERQLVSVANLTRQDAVDFLRIVPQAGISTHVVTYPLDQANEALDDLRHGRLQGAAVLVP
jgi:propanol-preferring alcohol dehydrogenase